MKVYRKSHCPESLPPNLAISMEKLLYGERMEIIMVFISLTSRHLGMDKKGILGRWRKSMLGHRKENWDLLSFDSYDVLATWRHVESYILTHMLSGKSKSRQIHKCDYLLCERILLLYYFFKIVLNAWNGMIWTHCSHVHWARTKETRMQALI